ncbi:hypothetical protein TDB9533_00580 [Thalassocella blandensis]|nr:hypothetical protein TDB9533_00580 [Thalassocella blandensis]
MLTDNFIAEASQNWVCWIILAVALASYHLLWFSYFKLEKDHLGHPAEDVNNNLANTLINVLPLLGLLGTIIGLLQCFAAIANDGHQANTMSDGISKALITTQLGLVCAIPGWLLQSFLRRRATQVETSNQHHSNAKTATPDQK